MRTALLLAALTLASTAHAVPMTLLGTQILDFESFSTGPLPNFFVAPISDGDFRVDSGSVSTSIGGLDPASGSNFALGMNNVNAANDASWFLDISAYAADIDSGNFGVAFSFLGDTNNTQASSGSILIRSFFPDLLSPVDVATLLVGATDLSMNTSFDTSSGYQLFSLFRDDLAAGTRSLQLNAGININSGDPGSDYALDDYEVRFYRLNVPEPGSMAIFGIGLVSLTLARRRRR